MTTRAFYLRHREKILAKSREYNRLHPEILKKAKAAYRARHPGRVLAQAKAGYRKRKALAATTHRLWVAANREKRAAYMKAWREKNAARLRTYDQEYKSKHPEQNRAKARRRRVLKLGCGGNHTHAEWLAVLKFFDDSCVYCGRGGRMTKDHIIPLSRKELNPTDDISNIFPACKSCNSKKHNKTDYEFRAWLWNGCGTINVGP